MYRRAAFLLAALALVGLAGVPQAQSWNFGTVANISDTMGVNDGRVCLGEGSRKDIGCPAYAPFVSNVGRVGIGTTNPLAGLDVSATFTNFIGAAPGQIGIGYFNHPSGWQAPSLAFMPQQNAFNTPNTFGAMGYVADRFYMSRLTSITVQPSIVFDTSNTRVGIGTQFPEAGLSVMNGEIQTASSGAACTGALAGAIRYTGGNLSYCNGTAWTLIGGAAGGTPGGVSGSIQFNSGGSFAGRNDLIVRPDGGVAGHYFTTSGTFSGFETFDRSVGSRSFSIYRTGNKTNFWDSVSGTQVTIDHTSGNLGVGTITPTARLEVAGRVSATVLQISNDGGACNASTVGTLRLNPVNDKLELCRRLN